MMSSELYYPHEDVARLAEQGRMSWTEFGAQAAREVRDMAVLRSLKRVGVERAELLMRKSAFTAINGPEAAELQGKLAFGDVVNHLGYIAPRSIVVRPRCGNGSDLEWQSELLDESSPLRFCKPQFGAEGQGIYQAADSREAVAFSRSQKRSYLVQTMEDPAQDWRYILHRDPSQISGEQPPGWRVAYQKIRPEVIGDGRRPILMLLTEIDMPLRLKVEFARRDDPELMRIPTEGEKVSLVKSGNISQGAYSRLPDAGERQVLDQFMLRFMGDVEEHYDTRLGIFCVDLGLLQDDALRQPYDHERLKERIVFYEHQYQFGMSGYLNRVPDSAHNQALPYTIESLFFRSVLASGVAIRKRNRTKKYNT